MTDVRPPEPSRWQSITCPRCKRKTELHILSAGHTCECGPYYVAIAPFVGWYESREAFTAGAERIAS